MSTITMTTVKSLTDNQIRTMQSHAGTACDYSMAAICDLAINGNGSFDANDWTTLTHEEQIRIGKMTRDEAYAIIVDALNN